MIIAGTIYASAQLGMRIKQSIIAYSHSHYNKDIRDAILNIKICNSPTESDSSPLVSLVIPDRLALYAGHLKE